MNSTLRFVEILILLFSYPSQASQLSDEGITDLNQYLEEAIHSTHIPGVVALVVNKDGVIYESAHGLMDTANNRAMSTDAIFRLASMTKAITSTAVMLLVEEEKIDLDDPVSKYLPGFDNIEVMTSWDSEAGTYTSRPAKNTMTIRHLLTNTSGLGYGFTSDILNALTQGDFSASATDYPVLFEPGTNWHYGESTRVLGRVIAAVTKMDLADFLQIRIFNPLQMRDTSYDVPSEKMIRVPTAHNFDGTNIIEIPNPEAITSPQLGDAGLNGTARDYAQFIRFFLNEGRLESSGRLLKVETVRMMSKNHTAPVKIQLMHATNSALSKDFPLGADVDSHALGFQRTETSTPNMRAVGSLAWAGIYNTEFWIDPENEIGAILLMQYLPFYDETAIEVLQNFEKIIYTNLTD